MTPRTLADLPVAGPRPLLTYYDISTGERTELSGASTANWVAKTAGFLTDEIDVEPGTRIRLGVPTHWLRFVWILAAWHAGAVIADTAADVAFVGPDLAADEPERVATRLHPMGLKFDTPPAGFVDFGHAVWSHPDAYVGPVVDAVDPAVELDGVARTHADVLATPGENRRLLVEPGSLVRDVDALVAAVLGGGSLVVVAHGDDADRARVAAQERAEIA